MIRHHNGEAELVEERLHIIQFVNKGIFATLEPRYRFAITTFQNSGSTDTLKGGYSNGSLDILKHFDDKSVNVPVDVLESFSPESRIFPYFRSQEQMDALATIVQHPSLGDEVGDEWFVEPYAGLHSTQDKDRYIEDPDVGDYPVYEGKNVYQFIHDDSFLDVESQQLWSVVEDDNPDKSARRRVREKQFRGHSPKFSPKKAVYEAFGGTGSQKAYVNKLLEEHRGHKLSMEDVLLDSTEYRVAFRAIARSTDERTIISSVIPPGVMTHEGLPIVRPYTIEPTEEDLQNDTLHSAYERIFDDKELFVLTGLLNSLPFDYLMRSKTNSNIVMYKIREGQVPRLTEGDDWFEYIWRRAAKLNCYGDTFEEMRSRLGGIEPITDPEQRKEVQAELDAAALHAYGIGEREATFIVDDFHQVEDPRMIDHAYFEMVMEKYRELSDD